MPFKTGKTEEEAGKPEQEEELGSKCEEDLHTARPWEVGSQAGNGERPRTAHRKREKEPGPPPGTETSPRRETGISVRQPQETDFGQQLT